MFIICLFIVCLCVCFLSIFQGASCWVMYQLCGLALLEGGGGGFVAISVEFCGGFSELALDYFVILWV